MKCRTLICAVLFGVFVFGGANPIPSQQKDEPPKKAAEGDDLAKLGKARRESAEKAYREWFKDEQVAGFSDLLYQLSIRWLNAELDLATKREQRLDAFSAHVERMKAWEKIYAPDKTRPFINVTLESFRKEAEYWLAKEHSTRK